MVKIVISTDWTKTRDYILDRIAEDVSAQKGGRFLVVPDLITHDMERRLSAAAGDTCSRFCEVVSFKRLAQRVAEYSQCAVPACLDNGGRIVAMAAAVKMLAGKLKNYACVSARPEFLSGLVDAVDEFKRCCISAQDLHKASLRTEGEFAQKLEELALIYESYDAITAQGKCDPRDQMTWLLEHMETTDFAEKHVFYVDGFPDLTGQHSRILAHLIENSPSVTVGLNCDKVGSDNMAFEKVGKTALDIKSLAGSDYETVVLDDSATPLRLSALRLFQGTTKVIEGLDAYLHIYRGESVYEECTGAAERVLQIVRGGGRYRDIGIVCADLSGYENALRLAFARSGIPYYRSGTDSILQKTVIRSLLCAMDVALGGFDRSAVLRYMRSVLCSLETETCDMLENYCFVWNVNGQDWCKPWTNHPDGLAKEFDSESTGRLAALEEARFVLVEPLLRLGKGLKEAADLSAQVKVLYQYFLDISLADRFSELAAHMDGAGDNRTAQIINQLWDILIAALEQLHDVLGSTAWDPESFVRLFTLLLSQYDVGTIPTVLDAVSIGAVRAMRCTEVRHLIILGAKEGALPSYSGSAGVLSDREREDLRALNLPLTGGGMEGIQSEFYEIYACYSGARETVDVFCGADQPSFIYNRLVSMAGAEHKLQVDKASVTTDPVDAAAWLVASGDGINAAALGIQDTYLDMKERAQYELGSLSAEAVKKVYGDKLDFSATQVDAQAVCRFSYFLNYGLKLKEMKEAAVDPAQFGTYFHDVLEHTTKKVKELGGFHKVSLDKTLELAMHYSKEYIREKFASLDSERVTYLIERNSAELILLIRELWAELSQSLFEPDQFELGFGEKRTLPAAEIPGEGLKASLNGYVDRVDKWTDGDRNFFRIVDYKTGKKTFDYCDVFNGIGLQMLLYLFALEQGGESLLGDNPLPAGVQYFAAMYPFLPDDSGLMDKSTQKKRNDILIRKGIVLNDDRVLNAMEPEGAPKRINVKQDKSGALVGDLVTFSQLKQLRQYVFKVLRRLVNEIGNGIVEPNPYSRGDNYDACRFCPYGAVCRRSTVKNCRNYKEISAADFWANVESEVTSGGR